MRLTFHSFHNFRLLALVLLMPVLFSCDLVNKEGASYPFRLVVDAVDGTILGDGTVIKKPELNFRIEGEDVKAQYSMVYTIDGSQDIWKRGIPADRPWNLQDEFTGWTLYGSHTVKGKVILEKDTNRTVSFNVTIWIKYASANVSEVYFNTVSGQKIFKDKCVLVTGTTGELVVAYVPETSLLHVDVTSMPGGVLDFSLSSTEYEPGFIRIPYEVKAVGEPVVTLTVSNGPDSESYSYEIDCREDDVAKTFRPYMTASDLVFEGVPVSVSAGLSSGNIEIEYDVDFAVDGNPSSSFEGVSLFTPLAASLSTEGLEAGSHEASCSVVPYAGGVQPQEASDIFYVYRPRLRVTDVDDVTKYLWPGESAELTVGNSYYVAAEGLPEQYAHLVAFFCDGQRGQLAGTVYSPTRSGNGALTLSVTDGKGGSVSFGLEQRERIAVSVETPVYTVESYPVWTTVRLTTGDASRRYDVDFLVDGTLYESRRNVYLSGEFSVPLEGVRAGDHTVAVNVKDSEGFSSTATASAGFMVGTPYLEVKDYYSGATVAQLSFGTSAVTALDYGKTYTFAVKEVPSQAQSLFSLRSAGDTDTVTGSTSWSVVPKAIGSGNITVHMDGPANLDFPFAFLRYGDLRLSVDATTLNIVKGVADSGVPGEVVFHVKCRYYGKMIYKVNSQGNPDYWQEETRVTEKTVIEKNVTVSGSGSASLLDFSSVVKGWNDNPYEFKVWSDEGRGSYELISDYAYYNLVVESLAIDIYGAGVNPLSKYLRVNLEEKVDPAGWLSRSWLKAGSCDYKTTVHVED